MARPKPRILLSRQAVDFIEEVVLGQGYWVVVYNNQPVNILTRRYVRSETTCKYVRTGFSNCAHAYRLAEKLNRDYSTDLFAVIEVDV